MKLPQVRAARRGKFKSDLEVSVFRVIRTLVNRIKDKCKRPIVTYETETLPYTIHRNYKPDHIIEWPDGSKLYIEDKGYLRPADRAKLLAVIRDNPDIDLRIVFAQDNKLTKKSRMRYSDWATKHGITYAIGEVPSDWINKKGGK